MYLSFIMVYIIKENWILGLKTKALKINTGTYSAVFQVLGGEIFK